MAGDVRTIRLVDDPQALTRIVAQRFVRLAQECIKARGRFRVAMGFQGDLIAIAQLLTTSEFKSAVEWGKVSLIFTHDIHAATDHPDNQFARAETSFLQHLPIGTVHRIHGEHADIQSECRRYENDVEPLDLALVSLSPDGTIAAIFPEFDAGMVPRLVEQSRPPGSTQKWITLSPLALSFADHVWVLASGAETAPAVHRALEGDYEPFVNPAQGIHCDGELIWFIDLVAASKLAVGTQA
jgi:6-phosphogluconolactonase